MVEFRYSSEDVEKGKEYIKQQLGKPTSEEIPSFVGWTPAFDLYVSGFKLEHRIDLLNVGKKTTRDDLVKKVKGSKKPVESQLSLDDGKNEIYEFTPKEREYARSHAGSKELFEKNKSKIDQAFEDMDKRNLDFIVFRSFRGWPAIWDVVEFYSKPIKK